MSNIQAPPIQQEMVDEDGIATLQWILFFQQLYTGDTGTDWTPTFTGLTEVGGAATVTGRYFRIGQNLCYFWVRVIPVTSTSATAGTTFVNNFPLTVVSDGACLAVSGLVGGNAGQVELGTNRIYPPSWSAVTVPLTIVGLVEVQ